MTLPEGLFHKVKQLDSVRATLCRYTVSRMTRKVEQRCEKRENRQNMQGGKL